ncbi:MAG: hypothetical protein AAF518_27830 [Spirochaetota bacterium]
MVKPTTIKDTSLFLLLFFLTSLLLGTAYSTITSDFLLGFSISILLIFALVFSTNRWKASKIKSIVGGISAIVVFFSLIFVVDSIEQIFGKIQNREDFIFFGFSFFSSTLIMTNLIAVALFLPRYKNIYLYLFSFPLLSVFLVLLFPLGMTVSLAIDETKFLLPLFVAVYFVWSIGMQSFTKTILVVAALAWGIVLGGIIGSVIGVGLGPAARIIGLAVGVVLGGVIAGDMAIYHILKVMPKDLLDRVGKNLWGETGLKIFFSFFLMVFAVFTNLNAALLFLIVLVILFANFSKRPIETFRKHSYYAFVFSVLAVQPCYFLYTSERFAISGFPLLIFLSTSFLIISQLYLLSALIHKNMKKNTVEQVTAFSTAQSIYNLLVITITYSSIFILTYTLIEDFFLLQHVPLLTSVCLTFLPLKYYNQIFIYFSQASTFEKEDIQNDPKTLLCGEHFLRPIKVKSAFPYSYHQCPVPGCGRSHLLAGIQEVVGIIGTNFTTTQKDLSLFVSLWDRDAKLSRYAEIQRLEVHFTADLQEEDYNYAIQAAVRKIYNGMEPEKRKMVPVSIEPGVILSEASKRLLEDNFGSLQKAPKSEA